jgi:hypothetical protein
MGQPKRTSRRVVIGRLEQLDERIALNAGGVGAMLKTEPLIEKTPMIERQLSDPTGRPYDIKPSSGPSDPTGRWNDIKPSSGPSGPTGRWNDIRSSPTENQKDLKQDSLETLKKGDLEEDQNLEQRIDETGQFKHPLQRASKDRPWVIQPYEGSAATSW